MTNRRAPAPHSTPVAIAAAAVGTTIRQGQSEPQPQSMSASSPRPSPSETPQPEPPAPERAKPAGGYMPMGTEDQPELDIHAREALERLNVHVTLTVVVSDSGKTERVTFTPEIDTQLETQIRALLENANWDPANCGGGIPCEGTAVIELKGTP